MTLIFSNERRAWARYTPDSPDESQTGINVRVFPALLQDGPEVLTAAITSGNPNAGRGSDLAIFLAFGRTPSVECS